MTAPKAPQRPVPTLTEVIDLAQARGGRPLQPASPQAGAAHAADAGMPLPDVWESDSGQARPASSPVPSDDADVADRVVASLQVQIDALFEGRMQQVLGPALARAADGLIRELRVEVDAAVRDLVRQAVANELARRSRR